MPAIIEVDNVYKTFRVGKVEVPAVRGVSLAVERGEFVSLVGPSGSGKSTLFYLLGGLTQVDSGQVTIDGVNFSKLSDAERTRMRKSKIGFVFQKYNLLPTLDARGNIDIAREISGEARRRRGLFRSRHLSARDRQAPRPPAIELSGGEQQRVALARALINKPAIVLADEPTGNLDTKNSEIVLAMLRRSNQDLGQTVLMITHNPEAAAYGDRILHMRDGQMVDATRTRSGLRWCSKQAVNRRTQDSWRRFDGRWTARYRSSTSGGSNSVVECDLAKVEVAGSNPVSRSMVSCVYSPSVSPP